MPQLYIYDRIKGKLKPSRIFAEKLPKSLKLALGEEEIELFIPIGYRPFALLGCSVSDKRKYEKFLLLLNSDASDLQLYSGYGRYLRKQSVYSFNFSLSKKLGGWGYAGAKFLEYVGFLEDGEKNAEIHTEEIAKNIIDHKPDVITLKRGSKKITLDVLL